ncbi:general secretion pathway protein GspB [Vibrio makurazakiensis]|uniref:general secretion pathway protein GspB n=1 Tax=Vibrio makurazakiensis TaxID=2910250 RepID=UPI003D0CF1AB
MSQVMKALRRGEKGALNSSLSGMYSLPQPAINQRKSVSIITIVMLMTLPALVAVSTQLVPLLKPVASEETTVIEMNVNDSASLQAASQIVKEQVRSAPSFGELKPLVRKDNYLSAVEIKSELTAPPSLTKSSPEAVQVKSSQPDTPTIQTETASNTLSNQESLIGEASTIEPSGNDKNLALKNLDMSEFSPELALTIESILQGSNDGEPEPNETQTSGGVLDIEKDSGQLQGWLPKLNFQTHMYSSDDRKRWIKVNDQEVSAGEWLKEEVQILSISPQFVTIEYQGLNIRVPALYEWQG